MGSIDGQRSHQAALARPERAVLHVWQRGGFREGNERIKE